MAYTTEALYTGNGSTTGYAFTFPYINSTDVKVSVDGVASVVGVGWNFNGPQAITFVTAPANGAAIRIYRETSIDSTIATFSSAAAIRGSDLNSNFTQVLYASQEANDSSFDTTAPSLTGPLNMNGYKVTSLGTPTSNTDAATKAYVDARTLSDGVRGEITISGGGGTLTVNNQAITAAKIQDNTITATQIATGAIGADELADNAVDSNAISAGAVTTSKIANGAVTATQIAADTITSSQIAANAITASELATGAVDNDAIGVGVITGDRLASKAITNAQIADNTIGAGQIANGAIGQAQIATNGVGSDEIAARAVTFAKTPEIMTNKLLGRSTAGNGDIEQIGIGANLSLSGGVLSATGGGGGGGGGTVTDNDYGDIVVSNSGATWTIDSMVVTGAKIAANTIEAGNIKNGAVVNAAIATGTITGDRLVSKTITNTYIADNTIGSGQLAADSVGASQLANGAVDAAAIQTGVIDNSKLADLTIQNGKIADATITGGKLANDTITATQIAANAIGSSELADNAVDTNAIAADAVTNTKILDGTITGAKLANNTITAAQIATNAITADELADGAVDTAAIADGAVTAVKTDATSQAWPNLLVSRDSSGGIDVKSLNGGPLGGRRNLLINGDFRFNQRKATSTPMGSYGPDRWRLGGTNTATVFVDQATTTLPNNTSTGLIASCTVADASIAAGDYCLILQYVEGKNIGHLGFGTAAAKPLVLSFEVRSTLTGIYCISVANEAANQSYIAQYTINTANTWEKKTIAIPGATSGTWLTNESVGLAVRFILASGTTFHGTHLTWNTTNVIATSNQVNFLGSNTNVFRLANVQLEIGDSGFYGTLNTPFERTLYSEELANCQRYYQKSFDTDTAPGTATQVGSVVAKKIAASDGATIFNVQHRVTMRATPTVTWYNTNNSTPGQIRNSTTNTNITVTGTGLPPASIHTPGSPTHAASGTASDNMIAQWVSDAEL